MKTKMIKKLSLCLFAISVVAAKAQITPSVTGYSDIREYDGSYEQVGSGHFFYPNEHETRLNNEANSTAIEQVQFYTVNTHPKKYLLRNHNLSFNYVRRDTIAGVVTDSLHRIDVEMYRSNPSAFLARVDTQNTAVLSYFNQWYGASGRTNVKGGAAIACQSLWPNIDMVYTSNNRGIKMYFIVYPGGNPKDVILHFKGSRANGISGNDLTFDANWEGSRFIKPRMYQYTISGSVVTPVNVCPASWQSLGSDNYGITTTASYITSLPLIIEVMEGVATSPTSLTGVSWSTYIGGSIEDKIFKSKSDNSNNLFIGGSTSSPNFPVNAGAIVSTVFGTPQSASARTSGFIGKFNPNGVLQWVTYVGGSKEDQINDFDFSGGDIYAVGYTKSANLPVFQKVGATTNTSYGGGTFNDGFIFQLSANGQSNNWLTYFGGNADDDFNACKFDGSGNFFVIGRSNSTNLSPIFAAGSYTQNYIATTPNNTFDGIVLKFDNTSTLNWFTFYGTNGTTPNDDALFGIDIDGTNVYVCGQANTGTLPGSINSGSGGILTKFSTSGALASARWTNNNLWNYSVKVNNNKVYTCGYSFLGVSLLNSGNYYFNNTAVGGQACFGVYDASLTNIHYTKFGGTNGENWAIDIQFAPSGVFYISGRTDASNFPINTPAGMYSSGLTGSFNYFVAAFKENNPNIIWSTVIGSQNFDGIGDGLLHCTSSALDGQGFLHLCGSTNSSNTYPLSTNVNNPYYQTTNSSAYPNLNNGSITRFNVATVTAVGIKDFTNTSFSLGFYPNPTAKELIIDNKELVNQNLSFAIYDIQGKKLGEGKLNTSEQNKIDVSNLTAGMYILNVSNGQKMYSGKFVKSGE